MRKQTVVALESPVEWFGKIITEIAVKEPTGGDFLALGDPLVVINSKDGSRYAVEQTGIIGQYLDRCLAVENGTTILAKLSLADGQKIRAALLSFFFDPDKFSDLSDSSPPSSSS